MSGKMCKMFSAEINIFVKYESGVHCVFFLQCNAQPMEGFFKVKRFVTPYDQVK